jgi:hypothetical protein
MMMETTTFQIRDEEGAKLSGEIEWGETIDIVRYHHPMTGELTESPLQGWANPPDAETGYAATARLVEAVEAANEFCADHVGYDHVEWRLEDGRLRMIGGTLNEEAR